MKLRVALFGTNYGASYLQPLLDSRRAELVAIGARGSRRSRELARLLEVPLHTSPADLLAGARPDAAIVAVPEPEMLILQLLKAGVHVLAEHPVTPALVSAATRAAKKHGVVFSVNAHFWDLPAPRRFIALCRAAGRPRAVVADIHPRALYSALDILARATDLDTFGRVKSVIGFAPSADWWPAAALVASANGRVPVSIQLPASKRQRDDGSDHVVVHRIAIAYARETITLVDTHGPVVRAGKGTSRAWWLAATASSVTVARASDDRTAANSRALAHFVRAVEGAIRGADLRVELRRTAVVATAWTALRRATRTTKR